MALAALLCISAFSQEVERRPFQPKDVHRINDVGDIAIWPDSEWIAYRVGTMNVDKDESSSELFMVNWEGSTRIQLTHTEDRSENIRDSVPMARELLICKVDHRSTRATIHASLP